MKLLRARFWLAALVYVGAPLGASGQSLQSQPVSQGGSPHQNVPSLAVVSVKENKGETKFGRAGFSEEGITVVNTPLLNVIRVAYNMTNSVDSQFIGMPAWAKAKRYDIEAKVDPADLDALRKLSRNERGLMLQALLSDRFGLKAHREIQEEPVYLLVTGKDGPKISKAKEIDTALKSGDLTRFTNREIQAKDTSMPSLAMMLTQVVHRLVLDRTGLSGNYDVLLKWSPELTGEGNSQSQAMDAGPSIFTAVQEQLGLKLEGAKAPVDVIVVDHLEQPSEN